MIDTDFEAKGRSVMAESNEARERVGDWMSDGYEEDIDAASRLGGGEGGETAKGDGEGSWISVRPTFVSQSYREEIAKNGYEIEGFPATPKPAPAPVAGFEEANNAFWNGLADGQSYTFQDIARHFWTAALAAREVTGEDGVALIAAERARQVSVEGWTPEYDAKHTRGEMALAAASYALEHCFPKIPDPRASGAMIPVEPNHLWPWDMSWWKPAIGKGGRVRNLVKAGALIAAEIDRLRSLLNTERSG